LPKAKKTLCIKTFLTLFILKLDEKNEEKIEKLMKTLLMFDFDSVE
jgi:hypothetical protein